MSNLKLVINNSNKEQNQRYFFEKKELKIILDLYAKMVSEGSWKDYGLSISSKRVSFSIFKNAAEKAIYNISKKRYRIRSDRHSTILCIMISNIIQTIRIRRTK